MNDAHEADLRRPIFKGCTRPAMLAGVPMIWLLPTGFVALLLGMYLLSFVHMLGLVMVVLLYLPFYVWMRAATARDDQRLHQLVLRLYMRARQIRAIRYWGAVSYSPIRYKRH